jgi:hypothetical protein
VRKPLAVALIALAAATAGLTQATWAAPSGVCGLSDVRPLWFDYAEGSVSFRNDVFGRPGIIAATSGTQNAADLRAGGAQTVYWWMKLNRLAGTPSAPTDPATVDAAADDVFDKAVATTECTTPLIVLNELNSAASTTPWTPTNAQYRANVLEVLQRLASRGALPILLLSARPYTGGDALTWWQRASAVAYLVREAYFPAPPVMRAGVVVGSRTMRRSFRDAVSPLTAIGIPPERLGIVVGFQSGPGKGGREGLQPTATWLRFVKLQTLAAKQAAGELKLGTVVSWGWGTFDQAGADVDKPKAACVYLWARDEGLCDGPDEAGGGFNASRTEGQLALPSGARCALDGKTVRNDEVASLAAVTRDQDVALSALFGRVVESAGHPVPPERVLEIERSIVAVRFGGSRSSYLAALRVKHASVAIARGVIADEIRRQEIAKRLRVATSTSAQVALYHDLYGALPVRQIRADPAPSWLGGRRRGFALVPPGPNVLLSLPNDVSARVITWEGPVVVTALEDALPLAVVSVSSSASAVRAALTAQARVQAYQAWTTRAQGNALNRVRCLGDVLPAAATVDLASYLPFLALDR